jgi:hypothetical protein
MHLASSLHQHPSPQLVLHHNRQMRIMRHTQQIHWILNVGEILSFCTSVFTGRISLHKKGSTLYAIYFYQNKKKTLYKLIWTLITLNSQILKSKADIRNSFTMGRKDVVSHTWNIMKLPETLNHLHVICRFRYVTQKHFQLPKKFLNIQLLSVYNTVF